MPGFLVATGRKAAEAHEGGLSLNEEKVAAQSYYLHTRVRRDVATVGRTSTPQFAIN
jgi:hypothetical protein